MPVFGGNRALIVIASLACALQSSVHAQCDESWSAGFTLRGVNNWIDVSAVLDDGSGPVLVVGGQEIRSAGGATAYNFARWDGRAWTAWGGQVADVVAVKSLVTHDDGSGPTLFAGGAFENLHDSWRADVLKWKGHEWTRLPPVLPESHATALCVHDDGSGSALYAAHLANSGPAPDVRVRRWNGSAWSIVGDPFDGPVRALAVYDDGTGPKLFAGGAFTQVGHQSVDGIALWNGSSWSGLPSSLSLHVQAMTVYDDGAGAALYAASFDGADSVMARWNGTTLVQLAGHVNGFVNSLCAFDNGGGAQLYAGGDFDSAFGVTTHGIVRFDGSTWSSVDRGIGDAPLDLGPIVPHDFVWTMCAYAGELHVGGAFGRAGDAGVANVARWNGTRWASLGRGEGVNGAVGKLAVFGEGSNRRLVVGGAFSSVGSRPARNLALWDGSEWSDAGTSFYSERLVDLTTWRPGGAFGDRSLLAVVTGVGAVGWLRLWDGTTWTEIALPPSSFEFLGARLIAYAPTGAPQRLYMAGGVGDHQLACGMWSTDGATWTQHGVLFGSIDAAPSSMLVFREPSGPALIVAGKFGSVDGLPIDNVGRFDGARWSRVGLGLPRKDVRCLAAFDSGAGGELYAGCRNDYGAADLMRWDGTSWASSASLGASTGTASIDAMVVHADASAVRAQLYVFGRFDSVDGVPAHNFARFDGVHWNVSAVGVSDEQPLQYVEPFVSSACVFRVEGESRSHVYVGGAWTATGDVRGSGLARWRGCAGLGESYCFADEHACPCDASAELPIPGGSPFSGCGNSSNGIGATLIARGALDETAALVASGLPPHAFTMFVHGSAALETPILLDDGVRCIGGALARFGAQSAVAGIASYPNASVGQLDSLPTISGVTPGSGVVRHYQAIYRDPTPSFCAPTGTLNATNACQLIWL